MGLPQGVGVWRNCCDLSIGVLAHRMPDGARSALISHENESRMVAWVGRQSLRIKSKRRGMGRDRGHVWRRTLSNLWHTFQTPPRLVHPECAGPSGSGRYGQAVASPRAVAMYERRMRSADVWRGIVTVTGFSGRPVPGQWQTDEEAAGPALSPSFSGRADQPRGLALPRLQPELSRCRVAPFGAWYLCFPRERAAVVPEVWRELCEQSSSTPTQAR
jgi:hypothetical protein